MAYQYDSRLAGLDAKLFADQARDEMEESLGSAENKIRNLRRQIEDLNAQIKDLIVQKEAYRMVGLATREALFEANPGHPLTSGEPRGKLWDKAYAEAGKEYAIGGYRAALDKRADAIEAKAARYKDKSSTNGNPWRPETADEKISRAEHERYVAALRAEHDQEQMKYYTYASRKNLADDAGARAVRDTLQAALAEECPDSPLVVDGGMNLKLIQAFQRARQKKLMELAAQDNKPMG